VEGLIYVAEYHQEVNLPPVPDDTPLVLANCFDRAGARPPCCPMTAGCRPTWCAA
jgi:hypothetical protein